MSQDKLDIPAPNLRCPKCGASDQIDVCASVWVRIFETDGEIETDADQAEDRGHDYSPDSQAWCIACGHHDELGEFDRRF